MKKLLFVLGVSIMVFAGWRLHSRSQVTPTHGNDEILTDRLWIDHLPRNERDTINIFALINEQPIGIFDARSFWQGSFDAFRYELHDGELRIVFPQTGTRETLQAKATHCDKDGWDYCLEISGSDHGSKRYYSMEDWVIGNVDGEHRLTDKLFARF